MRTDKKIFLDINVVVDFLERSRPRHLKSVELIEYLTLNDYEICISEDMLTTIYYISKKKVMVLKFLNVIAQRWSILHFGKTIIRQAIVLSMENNQDLEDQLQCLCALSAKCHCLITHDKTFYDCGITIFTAEDFLKDSKKVLK